MQSGWELQRNSREDPGWNDRNFSFSSTFRRIDIDRYHCNVLTRACVHSYETGFSRVFSLYLSSTSISSLRVAASLCFCSLFVYLDTQLFFALSFRPPTISHGRGLYPLSPPLRAARQPNRPFSSRNLSRQLLAMLPRQFAYLGRLNLKTARNAREPVRLDRS